MPRPVRITLGPLATADVDGIAVAQTLAGAGDVDLDGTFVDAATDIAVLDVPRRVIITSAGDDTGVTFTVYGNQRVDGTGNAIQEDVTGASAGAATTTLDFGQVTRVAASGATAGDIEVGTNGVASTPWQLIDNYLDPTNLRISMDAVGTVNYTLQYTDDDIMGHNEGLNFIPGYPTKIWDDGTVAAKADDNVAVVSAPAGAWRVTLNSGSGSVRIVGTQAGVGGIGS